MTRESLSAVGMGILLVDNGTDRSATADKIARSKKYRAAIQRLGDKHISFIETDRRKRRFGKTHCAPSG